MIFQNHIAVSYKIVTPHLNNKAEYHTSIVDKVTYSALQRASTAEAVEMAKRVNGAYTVIIEAWTLGRCISN